jgi:hypothetical protein
MIKKRRNYRKDFGLRIRGSIRIIEPIPIEIDEVVIKGEIPCGDRIELTLSGERFNEWRKKLKLEK